MGWRRRDFIRAAGVVSAFSVLPTLMPLRRASAASGRKQLFFLSNAQGTDMLTWRPPGGEALELSYQLEPLAAYRDNLLVLDGIDNLAAYTPGSDGTPPNGGHEGVGATLTGTPCPTVGERPLANGPSVDEIIGQRLHQRAEETGEIPTRFPVLRIGRPKREEVHVPDSPGSRSSVSAFHWVDQHVSAPMFKGPWYAYEALFGGLAGGEDALARLRAERRSVLDALSSEIGRVRRELPEVDRDRMDAHLAGIRAIETDLDRIAICAAPELPMAPPWQDLGKWNGGRHEDLVTATTFRVIASALTCGLTDVACYVWQGQEGVADVLKLDPNYADEYAEVRQLDLHGLAHRMGFSDEVVSAEDFDFARRAYSNLYRWRSERLKADFLDVLPADIRDNLTLVWLSEMSEGGSHSNYNIPLTVFQGSEVGYFQTGKCLRWGGYDPIEQFRPREDPGQPITKLLVSLCHLMGLEDVESVGDPGYSTGPLTGALL